MRRVLLGLLILFAQDAMSGDRPTGVNCSLKEPPTQSGEEFDHGITLRIFPRAKEIKETYTGCQVVWVPHASTLEILSIAVIESGHAVRLWSPNETGLARSSCRYREGKVIHGTSEHCPAPELLIMKSMAPGCVEKISKSVAAGQAVFPEGCDYE